MAKPCRFCRRSQAQDATVARNAEMGFEKGKLVFILEDPDGMPWADSVEKVIQSGSSARIRTDLIFCSLQIQELTMRESFRMTWKALMMRALRQHVAINRNRFSARAADDPIVCPRGPAPAKPVS
ncbi:hypothetical protein [Methylocaldum sp.]|uniref:hypothetical protein n=1 Tax=Methylocaldum sp. TaxID=1969727 RepID=UPI002D678A7F|nr:hypothetical protein [Methylocaldum sp.]HYE34507.1 hypothetical protein [Methylocaldum sp.]